MREFRKAMHRVAKRLPDLKIRLGVPNPTRRSLTLRIIWPKATADFICWMKYKFMIISRGSLAELIDDLNVVFRTKIICLE